MYQPDLNQFHHKIIFENIASGIVIHDTKGHVINANQYACDLIGLSLEEMQAEEDPVSWCDSLYDGNAVITCERHPVEEALRSKIPQHNATMRIFNQKEQSIRWVNVSCTLESLEGKIVGAICIYTDVTEQITNTINLYENSARLSLLVESLNAISWELDLKTEVFTYVSPYAEKMLGYPIEAWKTIESWKNFTHPEDREWAAGHCKLETIAGRDHDFSYRMVKKDGGLIWVRDVVTVIKDMNNNPVKLAGFIMDITDFHRLQTELEKKVAEEVEKNRQREQIMMRQNRFSAVGEMLGYIAHQWRQPLNTLGLIVQDLEEAYEYGELDQAYLKNAAQSSLKHINYLSNTIDNFRNFFKQDKARQSFSIAQLVEEARYLSESKAKNNGITVLTEIGSDFFLYGHKNEFLQALVNMITNAIESIDKKKKRDGFFKGEIVISTTCQKADRFQLCISDNGTGVAEDIITKIFDPYFTTKFQDQGTGIGLYMSKVVIEKNMNGILEVENLNEGCRFTISFPDGIANAEESMDAK